MTESKKDKDINVVGSVDDLLGEPKEKKKKQQRTLLLHNSNFEKFQRFCRDRATTPAHLVDRWIETFLKEYK